MTHLEAWLKTTTDGTVAFFVAAKTDRLPAARYFETEDEARNWVAKEAIQLNTHVEWITDPPDLGSLS